MRHQRLKWFGGLALVALLGCSDDGGGSGGHGGAGGGGADRDGGGAGSDGAAGGGGADGSGGGDGGGGGADGGGASCIDDSGCPGGARCDVGAGVCRPACENDFECGTSARCAPEGRFCEPLERCGADRSCSGGASCNCHGVCEPTPGAPCQRDLQCPTESYCDDCSGHCTPRVGHCGRCGQSSNACERRNDRCVPVGRAGVPHCLRACTGQPICDALGPGFECREIEGGRSVCVPRGGECSQPGDCARDADCDNGQFCNEALFCQRGCEDDTPCPNDQVCQNLRCRSPCAGDGDCGPNGVCQPDGHCRVPGGCVSSVDCLEPETHCDVDMQRCVAGCERDDDCLDATRECVDGTCRPRGCAGNYQCAFEEVCNLETALCEPAGGVHCEEGCDPQDQNACGGAPNRCLSLQDEEENPIGDFCFEACLPDPNECPQGYQCVDLEDQDGNVTGSLCVRRCDYNPLE